MLLSGFLWSVKRFRPREGWLAFGLLIFIVGCLAKAIDEAGWVPEVGVVRITAVFSLFFAYLLAKRGKSPLFSWILLTLYGLLITIIHLADLLPPLNILQQGFWSLRTYWLHQGAIFYDQSVSGLHIIATGLRSEETIIFAIGFGLAFWLLLAFFVWSAIRLQNPLVGLSFMGVAFALNGYFGVVSNWYVAVFIGAAALFSAAIHYVASEQRWIRQNLDYSSEIRLDILLYTALISIFLLFASITLPGISIPKMIDAFLDHPLIAGVTLNDTVDSVEQNPKNPGDAGGSGVMPRSYLLNEIPDLSEIVVMKAAVTLGNGDPAPSSITQRTHWRGLSYENYTGRGWALSEERKESLPAYRPVPLPDVAETLPLLQEVNWLRDQRLVRYTLGEPLQFDHDVLLLWSDLDDLARVQGAETSYGATTRISIATPAQLRSASLVDVPPNIINRYTQLPDSLPERVRAMANDVAGDLDNPFDQAHALEQFLRQYPYSLAIEPTPSDRDPVDYFLFDAQSGYCDYYATSMAVLARSLGIPARMSVGFLAQKPDEHGVQTIRQLNGHSWTEIYFAGYGWVEFEPTAAFSSPHDTPLLLGTDPEITDWYQEHYGSDEVSPSLPPRDTLKTPMDWRKILLRTAFVTALLLGMGALRLWQRKPPESEDAVTAAYRRLQAQAEKLGQPIQPQQTPFEFNSAFQENLSALAAQMKMEERASQAELLAARLSVLFAERQYANSPEDHSDEAEMLWNKIKRPLWALQLRKKFYGVGKKKQ